MRPASRDHGEHVRYYGGDKSFIVFDQRDPQHKRAFFASKDAEGNTSGAYLVVRYLAERGATRVLAAFLEPTVEEALRTKCNEYVQERNLHDWRVLDDAVLSVMDSFVEAQATAKQAARAKLARLASEPRVLTQRFDLEED
jgi:predicted nucleic acid-binding protein